MPSLGGESDILKTIQYTPGVISGTEGLNGVYVRGGSPDQNLILLDDMPLYYVNHLGGLVSIFNSDAIKDINFLKAGFPAEYGGRLSSIIDTRMKDGNLNKYSFNTNLSLISTNIMFETPIIKNTSSLLATFRIFTPELILKPLRKSMFGENNKMQYYFYDINCKWNYILSPRDRVFVSFYTGDDNIRIKFKPEEDPPEYEEKISLGWGNMAGAIRWNHIARNGVYSRYIFSYTRYRLTNNSYYSYLKELNVDQNFLKSGVRDYTAKTDHEINIFKSIKLKVGLQSTFHNFFPVINNVFTKQNNIITADTLINESVFKGLEFNVYCQQEFKLFKILNFTSGIRYNFFNIESNIFQNIEPRILCTYSLNKVSEIKCSFNQTSQYVHLLTTDGLGLSIDFWVPSVGNVFPEKCNQFAVEYTSKIINEKIDLSISSYYKNSKNLISYKEGILQIGMQKNWQEIIEVNGIGKSYGIEFQLQKNTGNINGWVSYCYSVSKRQFNQINNGNIFPFKYDSPHHINIFSLFKINKRINISSVWTYYTAYPITLPIGKIYTIDDDPQNIFIPNYSNISLVYGERNSERLLDYHRLDIGINITKERKHASEKWSFNIYNVYNRKNPILYNYDFKKNAIIYYSIFPIIPSISYSLKF